MRGWSTPRNHAGRPRPAAGRLASALSSCNLLPSTRHLKERCRAAHRHCRIRSDRPLLGRRLLARGCRCRALRHGRGRRRESPRHRRSAISEELAAQGVVADAKAALARIRVATSLKGGARRRRSRAGERAGETRRQDRGVRRARRSGGTRHHPRVVDVGHRRVELSPRS